MIKYILLIFCALLILLLAGWLSLGIFTKNQAINIAQANLHPSKGPSVQLVLVDIQQEWKFPFKKFIVEFRDKNTDDVYVMILFSRKHVEQSYWDSDRES